MFAARRWETTWRLPIAGSLPATLLPTGIVISHCSTTVGQLLSWAPIWVVSTAQDHRHHRCRCPYCRRCHPCIRVWWVRLSLTTPQPKLMSRWLHPVGRTVPTTKVTRMGSGYCVLLTASASLFESAVRFVTRQCLKCHTPDWSITVFPNRTWPDPIWFNSLFRVLTCYRRFSCFTLWWRQFHHLKTTRGQTRAWACIIRQIINLFVIILIKHSNIELWDKPTVDWLWLP